MQRLTSWEFNLPGFRLAGILAVLFILQALVLPDSVAPPPAQEAAGAAPQPVVSLDPRTPLPAAARRWVDETLAALSLEQRAGQVLMVRAFGEYYAADAQQRQELTRQVQELGLGGIILFRSEAYEAAALVSDLQASAVEAGVPPLLVAADFEWGAEFRVGGAVPYPTAMAIGAAADPTAAEWMGRASGRDARALGVQWIFAPVADVNNNPRNPVINVRSFGEDPQRVGEMAAAFVRGAQAAGAMATAKHFPGHGDTAVDSHIDVPVLRVDSQRLQAVELAPFRAAIDAGVAAIMTAHLSVPAITASESLPATLSSAALTDLLRRQLDFRGLVVTDAMEMGGIRRHWWSGQAAVKSLAAGADIVLLPPFPAAVHAAIVRAVEHGQLPPERLEEAVRHVLEAKARLGLQNRRPSQPLVDLPSRFAPAVDAVRARQVAEEAVTLLRDRRGVLPLDTRWPTRVLVVGVSDADEPAPTRVLVSALRRRLGSVTSRSIDGRTSGDEVAALMADAARADVVVMAVRVRVRSYQERIKLPAKQEKYARLLARLDVPVVVVALGSPYAVSAFPEASAAAVAFGWSDPLQEALAAALVGEIGWRGHLPVTVPGLYPRGYGLEQAALDATLRRPKRADPTTAGAGATAVPKLDTSPLAAADLEPARVSLQRWVANRAFPGAVYAIGHRNVLVALGAVGKMSYEADAAPMPTDAVFDLASLTKVVATTTIAMRAVEAGRLRLDLPVQAYVPEFAGADKGEVTVRQLLTHVSGLPGYIRFFLDTDPEKAGPAIAHQILSRIEATPLEVPPGERTVYSDLGIILFGEVLNRVLGEPYEAVAQRQIFQPLGMENTRWNPPAEWRPRIPPTEEDPWRGRMVWGEVHDENAAAMGGVAPHAGLFSSAGDLSIFAQMMLNGGTYNHHRIVQRATMAAFTRRQDLVPDSSRAIGWDTARPSQNWSMFSSSAFGHTGFTGTSIWIDPERQLFVILLTNRVHPTRENTQIRQARIDFHSAVVEAVDRALRRERTTATGDGDRQPGS
ncbi:MAG: glycoside hydrolase family 3 N-terminal domain-containing protein [Acidobacteriota bacterium]